eukprot:1155830-Pelagomonas_calceolata.AAC.5
MECMHCPESFSRLLLPSCRPAHDQVARHAEDGCSTFQNQQMCTVVPTAAALLERERWPEPISTQVTNITHAEACQSAPHYLTSIIC